MAAENAAKQRTPHESTNETPLQRMERNSRRRLRRSRVCSLRTGSRPRCTRAAQRQAERPAKSAPQLAQHEEHRLHAAPLQASRTATLAIRGFASRGRQTQGAAVQDVEAGASVGQVQEG